MLTRRRFLAESLLTLATAGCSTPRPNDTAQTAAGESSGAQKREPFKLTAGNNDGVLCYVSWWVAAERGFFAEEGLEVEFLEQYRPQDGHVHGLISEMLKGPAGPVPTDLMIVEYPALAAMASGEFPYFVVAGEHSGCRQIIAPVNSSIETVADLRGKRVGRFPTQDTLLWDDLVGTTRPDISPMQWVARPSLGSPSDELDWIRQQFSRGGLDAYAGPDPIPEILKSEGVARLIASNTWSPPLNGWYCCMLALRAQLVDAHPELPKAFTRAIRRAAAFVQANPADAVRLAIAGGHLLASTPVDLCARLLTEYVWTTTGRIQEDLERYFDLLVRAGRMPGTTPLRELVRRVYRSGD
jgi:sulfonate transport system substrate-binding protein